MAVATSLHSHEAAAHDAITRTPGSHALTVDAIRRLVARGIEVRVAGVLMAGNADHGPATEALIRRLGVLTPFKTDPVRPTGRGRKAESPAEVASCTVCDDGTFQAMHTDPAGPAPSTCWDGRIAVSPRGEVYPCIFSRGAKVGSVADTPLPQVLARGPLAGLWALTTDDVPECRDCDRKGVCFDCRALPLTALGDVTAKNPRCDYVPPARRPRRPRPEAARVRPGLLGRDLAGERLLVDAATARLHRLDAGAAAILDALAAGASEAALAAGLTRRFGLAPDEAASEIATVADGLWDAGLLVDPAGRDVTGDRVLAGVAPPPVPDALGLAAGAADPAAGRAVADTPAAEVPRRALLGLLGRTVALAADAAAWAELEALLAPLAADPGATPEATISVVSRRSAPHLGALHHVLVDGRQVRAVRTPGALRSAVEEVLCTLAAEGQGDLRLHAAVLVGPAGAVLIPGASGAGKSLLALAGVAAGLGYGTDEAARIPLVGEVVVDALPKPVTVKAAGRPWVPPALTARWIPPDVADPDDYAWVPLVGSAPAPVVAVVLPDCSGATEGLAPCEAGDAAEALLAGVFNLGGAGVAAGLEAVCRLVEGAACLRLDTRDLPAAGARLAERLGQGAARGTGT